MFQRCRKLRKVSSGRREHTANSLANLKQIAPGVLERIHLLVNNVRLHTNRPSKERRFLEYRDSDFAKIVGLERFARASAQTNSTALNPLAGCRASREWREIAFAPSRRAHCGRALLFVVIPSGADDPIRIGLLAKSRDLSSCDNRHHAVKSKHTERVRHLKFSALCNSEYST